jgi:hypothetical protein
MSARNITTFYLHPKLLRQAERGNHNFVNKISAVLSDAGMDVAFDGDDLAARMRAKARGGYSLFLMQDPIDGRSLTIRRTYLYPFWHIEQKAERWAWPVAKASFDVRDVDLRKAANFYRFWRERLFDELPLDARRDGFIYVPLQGQLLRKRSFQTVSPIEMVQAVLDQDEQRQVIVTLHPNETYSPQERAAIEAMANANARLFIQTGPMERYLQTCDYIVTQNSSAGFMGYFFGKPLILYAKSDFHHIALNVADIGADAAFDRVLGHQPNYAAYLQWFLQDQSINAGRPEAQAKIKDVLSSHGWPV